MTESAAYIDNLLNGTKYRTDNQDKTDESNVNIFGSLHKNLKVDDLKSLARESLEKVLSEDSELNELWSENEESYPKWKKGIKDLIKRLK